MRAEGRVVVPVQGLRYLPKYSPDVITAKFKLLLRKLATRIVPSLFRAIRSFVPLLSAQECANYFRHPRRVSQTTFPPRRTA
jgi:hypothetical protein